MSLSGIIFGICFSSLFILLYFFFENLNFVVRSFVTFFTSFLTSVVTLACLEMMSLILFGKAF